MKTARNILAIAIVGTLALWITSEFVTFEYTSPRFAFTIGLGNVWLIHNPQFASTLAIMGDGPGWSIYSTHPWVWFPMPVIGENGVNVPFWLVILVLLPPWFLLDRAYRKRLRAERAGCCTQCGYDLTGNESGVCSECGCDRRI